ncbi:bifunctional adenosylcobinamide kinase/adenosylcobinamide-phosphate guanylyltransferase [Haloglycomyces albus]|uniref:bifunctional adenosylcobinamide kinase/adenosylcobinamide-phosphate guanylyltransferase n=1 Tax=Haloglycomyces albus TaxID=526067 RepID=UPI0004BBE959|nr:bifunctional adenosylcobinamide kinase/adenosylcobinamide-phosphate guanylyltransferase [Haloglycomyces albus]
MTLTFISGGTRSGKSEHAESLIDADEVYYLATGRASDPEMAERIARHRERRPDGWHTVESLNVSEVLTTVPAEATILFDDVDNWLTGWMDEKGMWSDSGRSTSAERELLDTVRDWVRLAAERPGNVIVVAGQPGWGLLPMDSVVRRWVDLHGDVCALISQYANTARLIVHGRVVETEAVPTAPPPSSPSDVTEPLADHGDRQVPEGCVDLAVNVESGPPPWLTERLVRAVAGVNGYPHMEVAQQNVTARHGRHPEEGVILNGAAEGFELLARVLRPRLATVVHPTFTEGEAALRRNGVPVHRHLRRKDDWTFDPDAIPSDSDFVLLTRPDNPTGVVDPVETIARLTRPGRTVVVDEAFIEFLPQPDQLASRRDIPGLVTIHSLTKLWGMAGLRVGYALADPVLSARLRAARQPWPVNSLALEAVHSVCDAEQTRRGRAEDVATRRNYLYKRLQEIKDLEVWPGHANYLLIRTAVTDLRERLLHEGFAARRGETFPGLDRHYLRLAVRDESISAALTEAMTRVLTSQ